VRGSAANAPHAGSLPDGGPSGSIDRDDQRILDSRTQGRGPGLAYVAGRLDLQGLMQLGLVPSSHAFVRNAVPGAVLEQALEGKESQESNDPITPTPAREREIGERTLEGSKASKRACRRFTGELGSGERPIAVDVLRHARRTGLARRETVVLAHASGPSSDEPWQRVGAAAKAGRRAHPDRAGDRRTRTRKGAKGPARAGTAPREGKALKGQSSRDASGMEQGREA
jgi:hypothetical protein